MLQRVAQLALALERGLELRAQRRELGRFALLDRRLHDRDDLGDGLVVHLRFDDLHGDIDVDRHLELRLIALLLLRELGTQPTAEPGFGLVAHLPTLPKTWTKEMAEGPRMTTNIAGKMKSAVGNIILIGAFIAFSSAAA